MIPDKDRVIAEGVLTAEQTVYPRAVAARFDRHRARVVIALETGVEVAFPPRIAEGLEEATPAELSNIEISPSGEGLHWPALDADLFIPSLLLGAFGSTPWMARQREAATGKANSPVRTATREKGRKGGKSSKAAGG